MLDPELIKKIRQIQIFSSHTVNASFAGQYESVFRGQGMQFEEVREYTPGDDVRSIDWNVTARAGKPYIKRFVEEREMTLMLLVDLSASGNFATAGKLKNELAAELCAVLAFAAIKNNDKVGLIIFTDQIELFIPPKKGTAHVLTIIRHLLSFELRQARTDMPMALEYLAKVARKKATVFVVSDFICEGYEKTMRLVSRRHDVIAAIVRDQAELDLPKSGLVELVDAETGSRVLADCSSRRFRRQYQELSRMRYAAIKDSLRSMKVDSIDLHTDRPYINDLVRFFHIRHSRR